MHNTQKRSRDMQENNKNTTFLYNPIKTDKNLNKNILQLQVLQCAI